MAANQEKDEDARVKLISCPFGTDEVLFKAAEVKEELGKLTEIQLEIYAIKKAIPRLEDFLGMFFSFAVLAEDDKWRQFGGTCVAVERLGFFEGHWHYGVKLRPKMWLLTKRTNSRIFQEMDLQDIVNKVLEDAGAKDGAEWNTTAIFASRTYCVQYRETDFDFVNRLLQQEGVYYYFKVESNKEKLVFLDSNSRFETLTSQPKIEFLDKSAGFRRRKDHFTEFKAAEEITTSIVTLDDYDFEYSQSDLTVTKTIKTGMHNQRVHEFYDAPARQIDTEIGERFALVRQEGHALRGRVCQGVCDARYMMTGGSFTLTEHPVAANNREYIVISATHKLQAKQSAESEDDSEDGDDVDTKKMELGGRLDFGKDHTDNYRATIEALPSNVEFRTAPTTAWPHVSGFLTAFVTGPAGEEIYTDKFGRIKVQFHFDRDGKKDENTTCWIRVVTPWSGKSWGMVAIPRIGQEVMVQFEDGDPDRPICTGMLYNDHTMPPYGLPGNMTQQGIKTNKTKGGGGFNEFVMEDKKEEEFVRLQSERDYVEIIKNNADIKIGFEHTDKGNLNQEVYNDYTEKVGNNETREVGNDHSETIGNNETRDIGNDHTETIGNNETREVGSNQEETIGSNQTLTVGTNQTIDVGSNIEITAGSKIKLTCGGSSIEMTPSSITVKSPMITIKSDGMATVKAGGVLTLKGSMTLIN